jgi:hypothetical protein
VVGIVWNDVLLLFAHHMRHAMTVLARHIACKLCRLYEDFYARSWFLLQATPRDRSVSVEPDVSLQALEREMTILGFGFEMSSFTQLPF